MSNYLSSSTHYDNTIFEELVSEQNLSTTENITFLNCQFKFYINLENIKCESITFHNCIFKGGLTIDLVKCHTINISKCTFESSGFDLLKSESMTLYISIYKCNYININQGRFLLINTAKSKIHNFSITDCNTLIDSKNSIIDFLPENEINKVNITSSSIYSKVTFKGGNYNNIILEGEFHNSLYFTNNPTIANLTIESSTFKKRIDFDCGNIEYCFIHRSIFYHLVLFQPKIYNNDILKIKDLTINSSLFSMDIGITCDKLESLNLTNNNFQQLLTVKGNNDIRELENLSQIIIYGSNQGNIIIEKLFLDISIYDINLSNIHLKDLQVASIILCNLENNGSISFLNINNGHHFIIQNSISGKLNFINTNLNTFKEIVISNSKLEGINLNTYIEKIFSFSKNPKFGYGSKIKPNSNLKDVYNQLKKIARNKGDIDTATKYESKEYQQLLVSKKFNSDTLLLILNYFSNNNGKSWLRGVVFTLVIGFVFYYAYIKSIGLNNINLEEYILYISSFPKLELKKYEYFSQQGIVSFTIWMGRIFISYGIYQTIAAFRKYGKS